MKQLYESEVLFQLMERDGFNIPSSVPPYEAEIKAYLINQVKQAYPKLTDYEAEWLLYNYTKHLPAEFPISTVENTTYAHFENVVPFAYQSAILKGSTKYRDIDTGEILESFEEGRKLELVSVKMPVLTTAGKNLFDKDNVNHISGFISSNKTIVSTNKVKTYYIKCKSNTNYTISKIKSNYFRFASTNREPIGGSSVTTFVGSDTKTSLTITTGLSDNYLCFNIHDVSIASDITEEEILNSIQIEEGTQATPYEPYKSNILTVNEDVELRGIGDVKDTLDLMTGEVVECIGEIVLDGSQTYTIPTGEEFNTIQRFRTTIPNIKNVNVICDKLPTKTTSLGDDERLFVASIGENGSVYFNLLKTKATNIDELKTYLSQNPITIQYQLATESVKTVDLTTLNESGETVHFMPLEGVMNVSTTSETIQPTFDMNVPVEATTQNLASFIDMETEE